VTITNQDVKIYRGDTATLFVTLTQADGSPFDPTVSVEIRWRMARNWHTPESEALVRKQLGEGIELTAGGVNIDLEAADTDVFPGIYYHELKVWDVGDVMTAMTGAMVIKPSVQMGEPSAPADAVFTLQADAPTVT